MALKKNVASKPAFEAEEQSGEVAVAEAPKAEKSAEADLSNLRAEAGAEMSKAKDIASTAITKAQTAGVPAPMKFTAALAQYEDVFTSELQGMGIGTFSRVVVGLDGFTMDKTKELGNEIGIEVMSWNHLFLVSAGVNDAEANELVKYSHDGKTIDGSGQSVAEYLEHLRKVEGYEKASVKTYIELWGHLTSAAGKVIPSEDRQIVVVSLSPQSVNQFKRYQLEKGVKVSRGYCEETSNLILRKEKKTLKNNNFGVVFFSDK